MAPKRKGLTRKGGSITRSSGQRGGGNGVWYAIILICLMAVGAVAGYALHLSAAQGQIDEATLCQENGPQDRLAILLDLTDPLSRTQTLRLEKILNEVVEFATPGTAVALGVVSEDASRWGAEFLKCKPASGDEANRIYENPTLIQERFQAEFRDPLRRTIDSMMTGGTENASPIMEALQALLADAPAAAGKTSVVIVSDLLQHSETLSFYRGEGWEAFKAKGGPDRLARSMPGAELTLVRIPRTSVNASVTAASDPFWARYFDLQGAHAPFTILPLGDL